MDTTSSAASHKRKIVDYKLVDGIHRWELANGTRLALDESQLSEEIRALSLSHGIKQKVGDTGSGKTVAETAENMAACISNLLAGLWNVKVGGNSTLVEAVANLQGITLDESRDLIGSRSPDELKMIQEHKDIKAEIARIKAERLAKAAAADDTAPALDSLFQ